MKLYLFLRSLVWTSIFSASLTIAALIVAFITRDLALSVPLGLAALTFATLTPRSSS